MSSNTRTAPLAARASILPNSNQSTFFPQSQTRTSTRPSTSTTSTSAAKDRHLAHLHSQLAQLSANLSDLENLVRMTAVQAESMRGLGGWCGGLFMAASKEFEPESEEPERGGVEEGEGEG